MGELLGATLSDTFKEKCNLLSRKGASRNTFSAAAGGTETRGTVLLSECCELSVEWSCGGDKIVMDGPGAPWEISDTLLIPLRELINPFKLRAPLDELPLQ